MLKFAKMHGLGNDFMVVDGVNQSVELTPQLIRKWSHRHTGIGFDQCLIVERAKTPHYDFFYRIYNANGEEVGQCGNGARCLARFIQYYGLSAKSSLNVSTLTTDLTLNINSDNSITADLGVPKLKPDSIPLLAATQQDLYTIQTPNDKVLVHALSLGNPHAVLKVDDVTSANVSVLGKLISHHLLFPEQTNVGFMQIVSPHLIKLRVYERGVGETSACGSGAVAAAAVGMLFHGMQNKVTVELTGGLLQVEWPGPQDRIRLTGPAELVYEGTI